MSGASSGISPLRRLVRAELAAGIAGLRLFIACVAIAAFMLGAVWMLGAGLSRALSENGTIMLGGDVAVEVVNAPLDADLVVRLADLGTLSEVSELRSTAIAGDARTPVEAKVVDDAYPLVGEIALAQSADGVPTLAEALSEREGLPGTVVEPALLSRLGLSVGDTMTLGGGTFEIRAVLLREPDRLSAGFLVGPRVIVSEAAGRAAGLLSSQGLVDYRYRLRADDGDAQALAAAVAALEPERGWELETPADAGDRVRETVARVTTFLGIAAMVALAIGLTGAWAASRVWIGRRVRTIALYRLSGAEPGLVVALHGVLVAIAAGIGIALGLAGAGVLAFVLMDLLAARLHLPWQPAALASAGALAALTLAIGIAGACASALSGAARTPPGAAMRSADTIPTPRPRDAALGAAAIAAAILLAILGLPDEILAATAAFGLVLAAALLAGAGWLVARAAARVKPRGFVARVALQGLDDPAKAAMRAVAIGIGIAGITAVVGAQRSLDTALRAELPDRIPDLVLLDVQQAGIGPLTARVEADPLLGGLQASPFMRATITAVNGVPAAEALVREDKDWVISGDRSFAWAAEPTGAELLGGAWWPVDYAGPPLVSAEEDVQEAFDLVPGDTLTFSVLGRSFTAEVANIRMEYHRTFRPEFLLVASPVPFRDAPHSWIVTLEGETDAAVDALVADLARDAPGVTAIDVRRIVDDLTRVVEGAGLASLAIAGLLLVVGALALTAIVAADVDSRERQALAFTLVGASRREIAAARLAEAGTIGALAALVGGGAGLAGSFWLASAGLRVDFAPGIVALVLPLALGLAAALAAGIVGGLGAAPRGRGQLVRRLAG
ncbi:ABC transporter permease [Salinarimonas ramus]|uniref:ABC transporter permease n=1 Tax=Salinarimonas ramus TaxID=690164 RepID=A0A917QCP5_9HYPH|nr:FtsX-like permease family protein [Salinarimonas ramus]GGK41267.1 ABC transporter permease [Salinarimonas ramus]